MHLEDRTGLEIVKLGYAVDDSTDRRRNLHFRAEFKTAEGVRAALLAIGNYNGFDGVAVAAALYDALDWSAGPRVLIGREGSPVIYVDTPAPERAAVRKALLRVAVDELDDDGHRWVRAWWD